MVANNNINYNYRRKKITRYDTIDLGKDSVNPEPAIIKKNYPSFPPDQFVFNHDKFYRSANTFSTVDVPYLNKGTELSTPGPREDYHRKSLQAGVDSFKNQAEIYGWVNLGKDDEKYIQAIKKGREFKDALNAHRIQATEWGNFFGYYGPSRIFSIINFFFQKIYYLITREQPHAILFTYYYLYYYFLFTEYNLENVYLYFPILRLFFANQVFSTFSPVYFSLFHIILGFFIPAFFIFLFSQYNLIRSFFTHRVYFLSGITIFGWSFSLPFIYHFSGYSSVFVLFVFYIFFSVFAVLYIFELRPGLYPDQHNLSPYSSYFLPIFQPREILYLPVYRYRYYNWCKDNSLVPKNKVQFTKYPFTQNVKSNIAFKERIFQFRLKELSVRKFQSNLIVAPRITLSGLVFPRVSNLPGYSIQMHREFVKKFPATAYNPYNPSAEHDYYDEFDRENLEFLLLDHINYAGGYSDVSFFEFISKNKGARRFDPQFSCFFDEERDFYRSIPSREALNHLYPYISLNVWLNAIKPPNIKSSDIDKNFIFENIEFITGSAKLHSPKVPKSVPVFVVNLINWFFSKLEKNLNRVTFFAFVKLNTPRNTLEMLETLRFVNKVLIETRRISPLYYKTIFIFIVRSLYHLHVTFRSFGALTLRQTFTYTLILRQVEEIYINVSMKIRYSEKITLEHKLGHFFLDRFRKKLNGFDQIKVSRK